MPPRPYHHGDLENALIQAGVAILSREGMGALSLRRVARRVGVSHAAPYAHFADKQALLAAIATEGYRMLHDRIRAAVERCGAEPLRQLFEASWAYVEFALEEPEHFRITLSGVVEKQKDHPAYVEVSRRSFDLVLGIVRGCQAEGVLSPGPPEVAAVGVWSLVHGLVSLLLEGQISHAILDRFGPPALLASCLERIVRVPVAAGLLEARGARRATRRPRSRGGGPTRTSASREGRRGGTYSCPS